MTYDHFFTHIFSTIRNFLVRLVPLESIHPGLQNGHEFDQI
jgi:hypothetical protein